MMLQSLRFPSNVRTRHRQESCQTALPRVATVRYLVVLRLHKVATLGQLGTIQVPRACVCVGICPGLSISLYVNIAPHRWVFALCV